MRGTVVSNSEFKICEASQIEVIMWPLVNFSVTEIWIFLRIESSLEQKTTQLHKPIVTQDQQLSSLVVHTLQ